MVHEHDQKGLSSRSRSRQKPEKSVTALTTPDMLTDESTITVGIIVKPIPFWISILSLIMGMLVVVSAIVYVLPNDDGDLSACYNGRLLAATVISIVAGLAQIVFCFIFLLRNCGCEPSREWWMMIHIGVGILTNIPLDLALFFSADFTPRGSFFTGMCGADWVFCFVLVVRYAFYNK